MDLENKKILVIGAARSGIAAAKILHELGNQVILSDAKENLDINLSGVEIKLGKQTEELLIGVDKIIVSPAVPIKIPLLKAAAQKNIPIISEVEFAYGLAKSPICAVTGTNGKTTTVTLLGLLLKEKFSKVGVGGNIGFPLSEVALEIGAGGYLAVEISSYQMEATKNFKPHISAILNVTPDHLKRHGSMEVYQLMKEKIFAQQTAEDFLILNYDDERTRDMINRAACKVLYFSRQRELAEGAFIKNNSLVIRFNGATHKLCTINELGIKGGHNVENALAASLMAYLAGVEAEKISGVLKTFQGVEHRIEFVRELDGVKYYNDSIASSPTRTIAGLRSFSEPIVLIAGGYDKKISYAPLAPEIIKNGVKTLLLCGDTADAIENELRNCEGYEGQVTIERLPDVPSCVRRARETAKAGDVVLFSPASASFDMYTDFEERGRHFKSLVEELE